MKDIWDKKLPEDSFCHLKFLGVHECHNLVSLIPFNMLQRLQNLEEIMICKCDQMTCELVEWLNDEGKNEAENIIELLPTSVKKISLRSLPKLTQTGLNSGILAYMNLRFLSISRCDSLRNVFSASSARSLIHLKKLSVDSCVKMEKIVTTIEEEEGAELEIVFRQLEILELRSLHSLRCFCSSGFEEVGVVAGENIVPQRPLFSDKVAIFPALEELMIRELNMKDIWDKKLPEDSFCHLKILRVEQCHSLRNVFSASIARSLVHLKKLTVCFCDMMEEIVTTIEEEEGAELEIVFRQLEILELRSLHSLRCFCSPGENIIPKRPLFSDKVAFPCLMKLEIGGLSNLTEIWQSIVPTNSFCSLRELTISAWDKLLDADSSKLRARFSTLRKCRLVQPS